MHPSSSGLKSAALAYAKSGIYVFPLHERGKKPLIDEWQNKATADPKAVKAWWTKWPNANIGIHTGKSGFAVLDVDPRNGGNESFDELQRTHGNQWMSCLKVKTGGGGIHLYYVEPENAALPAKVAEGIDLKHGNGYVVAPPSIHPSGAVYEFERDTLTDGGLDFCPVLPTWCYRKRSSSLIEPFDWAASLHTADPETPENIARVIDALSTLSADCDRDTWRNVGFAILSTGWECAVDLFRDWSMTAPERYTEEGFDNVVDNFRGDKPNGITLGTLFALAAEEGWKDPRKARHVDTYGDISNGRRFAEKYRGQFLFCHGSGAWYGWSGQRWAPCENGEAIAAAKVIADDCLAETSAKLRDDGTETAKRNFTQALAVHRSIRRLEAMLQAAASEPDMSIAHPGLFDADPWKICVGNGVLDLRNAELIEARPEMRVSRQAGSPYLWQAGCPQWLQFLNDAMQGDVEMVAFLQRICGYALTGLVDEEKLFFFYGIGANGKSVFANVLAAAMGEYAVTVRAALLARDPKGNSGDAEREKARLPGARVALINETGQGDVWDDQRTKELVSRERISARYLHRESFDFMPSHKLFVRGNHQPGAMDGSDGFWRRIVLIGFTRQLNESERILDLDRRIIDEELPGVLTWMVDGCLEWQRHGLKVPASIKAAVDSYRRDTDLLGEWLGACCTVAPGLECALADLFTSYDSYLRGANVKPPSRNAFGRQLIQRGFKKRPSNGRTIYVGIAPQDPFAPDKMDEL